MPETPGYFRAADGTPLYGVYHEPERAARLAVVIAPALFEERKSAYAVLAQLARELVQHGHPVFRFDYRGSGESGGASAQRRWSDLAGDLAAAQAALLKLSGQERAACVGLRLGATLALQSAAELKSRAVVALAPVAQGAAQARLWRMRSKIRSELTAGEGPAQDAPAPSEKGVVDLDGFAVGAAFLEDIAARDLLKQPGALDLPTLLVQISHRTDASPESEKLQVSLGPRCALACFRLEPFWDRVDEVDPAEVIRKVVTFLGELSSGTTKH